MNAHRRRRARALQLSCSFLALSLPVACAAATPASASSQGSGPGTTIVGGEQSPIGLYIAPWKNAYPQQGLYQPSKHRMQIMPEPIDPDSFHRKNVYYDTITAYRKAELAKKKPPAH